jgi:hypothetical protein
METVVLIAIAASGVLLMLTVCCICNFIRKYSRRQREAAERELQREIAKAQKVLAEHGHALDMASFTGSKRSRKMSIAAAAAPGLRGSVISATSAGVATGSRRPSVAPAAEPPSPRQLEAGSRSAPPTPTGSQRRPSIAPVGAGSMPAANAAALANSPMFQQLAAQAGAVQLPGEVAGGADDAASTGSARSKGGRHKRKPSRSPRNSSAQLDPVVTAPPV